MIAPDGMCQVIFPYVLQSLDWPITHVPGDRNTVALSVVPMADKAWSICVSVLVVPLPYIWHTSTPTQSNCGNVIVCPVDVGLLNVFVVDVPVHKDRSLLPARPFVTVPRMSPPRKRSHVTVEAHRMTTEYPIILRKDFKLIKKFLHIRGFYSRISHV